MTAALEADLADLEALWPTYTDEPEPPARYLGGREHAGLGWVPAPTVKGEALCAASVDADPWFSLNENVQGIAARICARCPLMEHCRREAREAGVTDGIWGGLLLRRGRTIDLLEGQL